MGQQQLLLIVLGIVIVGIAITVGINLFRANSVDEKRDLLINESASMATLAMGYYKKPASIGGGGRSFIGWTIPQNLNVTASGSYTADVFTDSVVINCTGNEVVTGNDSVKVRTVVLPDRYYSTELN